MQYCVYAHALSCTVHMSRKRIWSLKWQTKTKKKKLAIYRAWPWISNCWEWDSNSGLSGIESSALTTRPSRLQSWPKLCGTSLQNALPRPSISFSHGNKRSLGQILPSPPSPHAMLFVRKGLPTSRPTLHRGGRGERANIAAIREKRTLSHTFWPGLSISRTFTTNAHNSKCMECTVSKFVWVKFVHVLHTSLTSRL